MIIVFKRSYWNVFTNFGIYTNSKVCWCLILLPYRNAMDRFSIFQWSMPRTSNHNNLYFLSKHYNQHRLFSPQQIPSYHGGKICANDNIRASGGKADLKLMWPNPTTFNINVFHLHGLFLKKVKKKRTGNEILILLQYLCMTIAIMKFKSFLFYLVIYPINVLQLFHTVIN